jgi:hypothetical protein
MEAGFYDIASFFVATGVGLTVGTVMNVLWSKISYNPTESSLLTDALSGIIGILEVGVTVMMMVLTIDLFWEPTEFDAEIYKMLAISLSMQATQGAPIAKLKGVVSKMNV